MPYIEIRGNLQQKGSWYLILELKKLFKSAWQLEVTQPELRKLAGDILFLLQGSAVSLQFPKIWGPLLGVSIPPRVVLWAPNMGS